MGEASVFQVGIEECALGLLRLGWLIRFVSHTVVSGFTSGAAITIAFSQVRRTCGFFFVKPFSTSYHLVMVEKKGEAIIGRIVRLVRWT